MCGRNILIVEKRKDIQRVLKLGLEMESPWQIFAASSEREVFNLVEVINFDAVILDTIRDDRLTIIEQLKSNCLTRKIPIVAIAETDRTGEQCYLQKLGVAVVIPEMFDPICLADRIAKTLNWSSIDIEVNKM